MGIFGKKNKNGNRSVNLKYVDGVESYSKGTAVELSIDETNECISMIARVYKKPPVHLKFEQIINVKVVSEKEIIEESKSVIGRAVVGDILLGPLGAIIGGMSGIGSKSKSATHYFMVINYKSISDEIKILSFEIVGASLHWSSFVDELKLKIKKEDVPSEIFL